jgi:hypothetical protein
MLAASAACWSFHAGARSDLLAGHGWRHTPVKHICFSDDTRVIYPGKILELRLKTEETHKFRAVGNGLPVTPVTMIRFVDPTSGMIFAHCTCVWRPPFIKLLSSSIGLYKLVQTFTEAAAKKIRDATPAKYKPSKYDSKKS